MHPVPASAPQVPPIPGPGAALIHEPLTQHHTEKSDHTIQTIQQRWEEVLDYIQHHAPSLSFVLGVAQPIAVNNTILTIAFSYKFHQDIINNQKNKAVVQQALRNVFGVVYDIRTIASEEKPIKTDTNKDDVLAVVLETFEGAVAD